MQNIEAILTELGIEVSADKKESLTKKVAENYVTKAEHEKKLGKAETDRDTWKEKAETAESTLKGFEGVDLETMQKDLADWKKKAEDAEKNAQAQLYERDFTDALKMEFEVKEAGLKLKDGKILGLNDLITQMKEKDASAFVDDEQQKAQQNQARFTQPTNKQGQGGALTKDQIMSIKDASERQAAIAANMSLFN